MLVYVLKFLLICHLEFPDGSGVVSNYRAHLNQVHRFALKSKIFNLGHLKPKQFLANEN